MYWSSRSIQASTVLLKTFSAKFDDLFKRSYNFNPDYEESGVKAPWWNHLVKIHFVKSVIWWMCIFKWWNELAHREIWYHLVKKNFNSWYCHSIGENEYQLVIINSIREHFSDSDDTSLAINLSIYSENDILSRFK